MSVAKNLQNAQIALLNLDNALVQINALYGSTNTVVSTSASSLKSDIERVGIIVRLERSQEQDATNPKQSIIR